MGMAMQLSLIYQLNHMHPVINVSHLKKFTELPPHLGQSHITNPPPITADNGQQFYEVDHIVTMQVCKGGCLRVSWKGCAAQHNTRRGNLTRKFLRTALLLSLPTKLIAAHRRLALLALIVHQHFALLLHLLHDDPLRMPLFGPRHSLPANLRALHDASLRSFIKRGRDGRL
jgi:hypothetical protein